MAINTGYTPEQVQALSDIANSEAVRRRIAGYIPQTGAVPQALTDRLREREAGLEGYTPQELQAMRSQVRSGISAEGQTRNRALAAQLAQRGIQGGAAAAQMARSEAQTAQQRAMGEQRIAQEQFAEQQRRLGGYERLAGDVAGLERAREQARLSALLGGEMITGGIEAGRKRGQQLDLTLQELRARGFK